MSTAKTNKQPSHIIIGRLRRDVMLLNSGTDLGELQKEAELAVKQGRAAETFVVAIAGYYSEADTNWDPEGTNDQRRASDVPPLNPGPAEQQTTDNTSPLLPTSIAAERAKAAAEQEGTLDLGTNTDGTPTGKARSEAELNRGVDTGGEKKADGSKQPATHSDSLDLKEPPKK